jgi:hypothetical protein
MVVSLTADAGHDELPEHHTLQRILGPTQSIEPVEAAEP